MIFRKSACAPGAALRTIAYELYRRREKHSPPPSISHPLVLSFVPFSLSPSRSRSVSPLSYRPFRPPRVLVSPSLLSFALSSDEPSLSRSRALRVLSGCAMFNLHPAAPSSSFLPCSSTFRRVLKIARKKRRKLALISLAFFRALEKVGRSSYALAPSFLGNRLLRGDTAASSLQLSALLFVQRRTRKR